MSSRILSTNINVYKYCTYKLMIHKNIHEHHSFDKAHLPAVFIHCSTNELTLPIDEKVQ